MAYTLNADLVRAAFAGETLPVCGESMSFEAIEIGHLHIGSRHIAASDPFADPDPMAFAQTVPNGSHPVSIAVAKHREGDERIALARVTFSNDDVARWQMAVTSLQQGKALKAAEYFGYGVDTGTGCFMDPAAGRLLDANWYDLAMEEMKKTYRHTRDWCDLKPSHEHPENVICFTAGYGDGRYPSFFGFTADDRVCALITDFLLVDSEQPAIAWRQRPWWRAIWFGS